MLRSGKYFLNFKIPVSVNIYIPPLLPPVYSGSCQISPSIHTFSPEVIGSSRFISLGETTLIRILACFLEFQFGLLTCILCFLGFY